ncbi:hypothetical protein [Lacrimispora aerotolerans]|jgi:hypothetical protein|uniref:hypothetical protein n=1 Tax=Lacrimispora aerotolerans TaxID=36832 RepID=UPI00047D10CB|nr:hypothetical protein [Lacrimispora aerotolerans]
MLDKIMTGSACLLLLGVLNWALNLVDLQFKFMSFLGDYMSIFNYTAIVVGLTVCVVASRIKKNNRDIDK